MCGWQVKLCDPCYTWAMSECFVEVQQSSIQIHVTLLYFTLSGESDGRLSELSCAVLWEFYQIYNIDAVGDKDEPFTIYDI